MVFISRFFDPISPLNKMRPSRKERETLIADRKDRQSRIDSKKLRDPARAELIRQQHKATHKLMAVELGRA